MLQTETSVTARFVDASESEYLEGFVARDSGWPGLNPDGGPRHQAQWLQVHALQDSHSKINRLVPKI